MSDEVRLAGARHPLLDPKLAVPIDLDLGDLRALVISGPNTGGKTVALKTLGLAALLHQAGLRPPAETAALPVFDQVLADIGDRQSIEMSLSTFSGHVASIVSILNAAGGRSLVLLDELASGTDPVEGSALAQALVARLAEQARLTLVTTHYPELKEWASATDGVANAGTGFDPDTHAPLYRIALGRPGTSHALQIAERLGLDSAVVASARELVTPERLRIQELLAEAESAERAAVDERASAESERADAARVAEDVRERERELEAEIAAVKASAAAERERAAAEAQRDLAAAREELSALREEIRVARRRDRESRRATPAAARERDRRLGAAAERAVRAERAIRELDEPLAFTGPLAPGDPVEAPSLGVHGTIATIEGDEAEVVGAAGHRLRIPLARLQPSRRREPEPEAPVKVVAMASGDVSDELDVRGQRAQEAREAVRSFVDDAALAGLPSVRVIHGRGTGSVRAAVRDELDGHPARRPPRERLGRRRHDCASSLAQDGHPQKRTPFAQRSLKGPLRGPTGVAPFSSPRFLDDFRGVELVRQRLQHAEPRLGHVEEALERERLQPREVGARLEHARHGRAVAAERDVLDAVPPRPQHARRLDCGRVDQLPLLLAAAASESVGRRAALLVAALDEARADLGRDETLALEDAGRVAAHPHEQDGDARRRVKRVEQRSRADDVVLALVREAERRRHRQRGLVELDPSRAAPVDGPSRRAFESAQPLRDVRASDVARLRHEETVLTRATRRD